MAWSGAGGGGFPGPNTGDMGHPQLEVGLPETGAISPIQDSSLLRVRAFSESMRISTFLYRDEKAVVLILLNMF